MADDRSGAGSQELGWHWGVSNVGLRTCRLWLEPWADEVEVPVRSSLTLRVIGERPEQDFPEIEVDDDGFVVWAVGGTRIEAAVAGEPRQTGSAEIEAPGEFGLSTKRLLTLMFEHYPPARLGGAGPRWAPETLWAKLKRWFTA